MERYYYVYIMCSRSRNLYTGVTNNLAKRAYQHREGLIPGFTRRYHISRLVYFQTFREIRAAIEREKQIKAWTRAKRVALIESMNPTWADLAEEWFPKGAEKVQIPRGACPERRELQIPRFARNDPSASLRASKRGARDDNREESIARRKKAT